MAKYQHISGYYEKKRNAYACIRSLLEKSKNENEICLTIMNRFGFSKKFVIEYIELLYKVTENGKNNNDD